MYLFKAIKLNDSQISIVSNDRITRRATTNSVTLKISRVNTLTFQNSFYNRAPRLYNSLPPHIREASVTVGQFESCLLTYYEAMTKQIYNIMFHKRLKVSVSSVTRAVVRCPVSWIKCVVNNVMFLYVLFKKRTGVFY